METKEVAGISVISVLALILAGIVIVPDATHYCDSEQKTKYCASVSESGLTCYVVEGQRAGSDVCSSGWKQLYYDTEATTGMTCDGVVECFEVRSGLGCVCK